MGCGASTDHHEGEHLAHKGKKSSSSAYKSTEESHTSGYLDSATTHHQDELEDSYDAPLNEEQLGIIAEMDKRSTVSTAESAVEPSAFAAAVLLKVKIAKARVFHGIDGSCPSAEEIEVDNHKKKCALSPEPVRPFGDLKPRQVRKIQDWVQKAHEASDGHYESVPDRYLPTPMGTESLTSVMGSLNAVSPRCGSTREAYPETPKSVGARFDDASSASYEPGYSVSSVGCTPASIPGLIEDADEGVDKGRARPRKASNTSSGSDILPGAAQ